MPRLLAIAVSLGGLGTLLAQVPGAETLNGVNLVGTIVNGSVLVWLLLVRLPAGDKLVRDLSAEKDAMVKVKDEQIAIILDHKWAAIQTLMKEHGETTRAVVADFRLTLKEVADHCEKEAARLVELWERERTQAAK